jgi:hypothetical protein
MSTAVQVYHALIQPHFDYFCSVWDGLGETLSTKLHKLQKRAVRVIMRTSYDTNADVLLDILHLDNLSLRRNKLKIGFVFRTFTYLQSLFSTRSSEYDPRNSEMKLNNDFTLPRNPLESQNTIIYGILLLTRKEL